MSTCALCQGALIIDLEPDDDGKDGEAQTSPDDLQLPCGCHFHWECLLDQSPSIARTLSCPSCESYLTTNAPGPSSAGPFLTPVETEANIPVIYVNEGGTTRDLNLYPRIREEAYLLEHPEARPARAMHLLCLEGDIIGILELWRATRDTMDPDEGALDVPELILWQDPLAGMRNALHCAVSAYREEVVWLLLWVGSALDMTAFPSDMAADAVQFGLEPRPSVRKEDDIRALRDDAGRTAGDYASAMGGRWAEMVDAGVFEA